MKPDKPIIQSLLDLDLYKLTMLQWIFHRYPNIQVRFGFMNRTKQISLPHFVDESALREELDHAHTLQFTKNDLKYIASIKADGVPIFTDEKFVSFLREFQLPPYELEVVGGQFRLEFPGQWQYATLWETIALAIVNELYMRFFLNLMDTDMRKTVYKTGRDRLMEKTKILREHPNIRFIEFATRRRASREWQSEEVGILAKEVPTQLLGTSNVELAHEHGIQAKGTMAHELFMVMAAHAHATIGTPEAIRVSHNNVLDEWWDEYGEPLSIALPDTFGTDFAFSTMTEQHARLWKGQRQDSGIPTVFIDKQIAFYERHGVDPKEKIAFPSDGLTISKILAIDSFIGNRIKSGYGWGTNLSNDRGFQALSLVVKATMSSGIHTVKLSDNVAKATGPKDMVEFYKSVFGYTSTFEEGCVY